MNQDFNDNGYFIAREMIDLATVNYLKKDIIDYVTLDSNYGIRDLLKKVGIVKDIANSQVIKNIFKSYFR